jgi:chemotaxis protein methyltransferase CheR
VFARTIPGTVAPLAASADESCVAFLQWALPRVGLRWAGFRKVRRQVCRRLQRRVGALGLAGLDAYRAYLDAHPEDWAQFEALTPVTISRFYRDRAVFARLEDAVLPALAAGRDRLTAWSAGCASGEEAYTLALLWEEALAARFPALRLGILATDVDPAMLRRAREATYEQSSLRELPAPWRERGFVRRGGRYALRPRYRRLVHVRRHDLRTSPPAGPFDLVLCRNVAFTYFEPELQRAVLARLIEALRPGGALVIGLHEQLPLGLEPWPGARAVYRPDIGEQ